MTNTVVITLLGKEVGAEQGETFESFRKKAIAFIGKYQDSPEGSPKLETVRTLTRITNATKGNKLDTVKTHPWETVVHENLFGSVKKRMITEPSRPAGRTAEKSGKTSSGNTTDDTSEFLTQAAIDAAKNDLQVHLRAYQTRIHDSKKEFERRSVRDLGDRKRAVTQEIHDYQDGVTKLREIARALFEKHTEAGNTKTVRAKQIAQINDLAATYDVFLKDHAPDISKHIKALDDNALVLQILPSGCRLSSLFIGADDATLETSLETLGNNLGDHISTGIFSMFNPRMQAANHLATSGQKSIKALLQALDKQRAEQGMGLMALHNAFRTMHSHEASMAIWDACFGVSSAEKTRENISKIIAELRSKQASDATQILDGTKLIIEVCFKNDYHRLEGFTAEQRRFFKELNAVAMTQPHAPNGTRTGVNNSIRVEQKVLDNMVHALQHSAIEHAHTYAQDLNRTAQERIARMSVGSCPYTTFEKSNIAFVEQVVTHLNATPENPKDYINQARKLHDGLREKIRELSQLEKGRPRGAVVSAHVTVAHP